MVAKQFSSFSRVDNILIPAMSSNQDVDFEFKLPTLNMSCSAFDMLYIKSERKEALSALVKHLQDLSQQARLAGRHQVKYRSLEILASWVLLQVKKNGFKGGNTVDQFNT